jgi:hypothetical protein
MRIWKRLRHRFARISARDEILPIFAASRHAIILRTQQIDQRDAEVERDAFVGSSNVNTAIDAGGIERFDRSLEPGWMLFDHRDRHMLLQQQRRPL